MYVITKYVTKGWKFMNSIAEGIEERHPKWKFGFVGAFNKIMTQILGIVLNFAGMVITNFGTGELTDPNVPLEELMPKFVMFILFVFSLFDSKAITSILQAIIHFFKNFSFLELWTNIAIVLTGAFTNVVYSFLFPLELVFNIFGIHNYKIKELVFYNAYKDFYWVKCITNVFILLAFTPFCIISNNGLSYTIIFLIAFCIVSNIVMLLMSLRGKIQVSKTTIPNKINPLVLDI